MFFFIDSCLSAGHLIIKLWNYYKESEYFVNIRLTNINYAMFGSRMSGTNIKFSNEKFIIVWSYNKGLAILGLKIEFKKNKNYKFR